MEETNDVIPVKWKKILASLGYVTSQFVATNNENFKILKDMVDFYLRYKKKPVIQCRCNQITLNGVFSKD
jgi:glycine betaine/choline ABC-type transport system substrate-binding protein